MTAPGERRTPAAVPDEQEDLQPGLAAERTRLAWTRTAISFAAVGGAVLKTNVTAGLTVLAMSVAVWALRQVLPARPAGPRRRAGDALAPVRPVQLLLVTVTVTALALVALAVALLGHPGLLR